MRLRCALAPVVLGVLALQAGCGGDDRLSKAEFQQRANAACRDANRRIKEIPAPHGSEEIVSYVDAATAELDRGIAALRKLEPPKELEADYDRFLKLSDRTRAIAGELRRAARASDEQAMQAASDRGDVVDRESDAVARRLGLDACVED